jgi:transposase
MILSISTPLSWNTRATNYKKGKTKAKRFDLNQINLALFVTKDGGIPLMHLTYEGNMHDAKKFHEIICKLADRSVMFSKNVDKVTVAFDKENNSKASRVLLDDTLIISLNRSSHMTTSIFWK